MKDSHEFCNHTSLLFLRLGYAFLGAAVVLTFCIPFNISILPAAIWCWVCTGLALK